jgi:hypothetical protein
MWLQTPATFEQHAQYGIEQYLVPLGLMETYNLITRIHAPNQPIVILHDDLDGIREPSAFDFKTKQVEDCGALFERVFALMKEQKAVLGGLYGSLRNMPTGGADYSVGIQMIFDPCTFIFNQHSIILREEFALFLDIHRMLEFHKAGHRILRMNKFAVSTTMNKENDATGLGFRTKQMWDAALPVLVTEYRQYISRHDWAGRYYTFKFRNSATTPTRIATGMRAHSHTHTHTQSTHTHTHTHTQTHTHTHTHTNLPKHTKHNKTQSLTDQYEGETEWLNTSIANTKRKFFE